MDAYLDALQKQFIQAIFESQAAGRIDLQVAVQLAMVARFYERIGDHAVNIGERVRFIDHRLGARPPKAASTPVDVDRHRREVTAAAQGLSPPEDDS